MWQQADAYALQEPGRDARRAFALACCDRIRDRLQLEVDLRRLSVVMPTGRSVTVAKGAIVDREFEKLNLHLRSSPLGCCSGGSETAAAAGRAAGGRAGFGRPVNGGKATRAIGKK